MKFLKKFHKVTNYWEEIKFGDEEQIYKVL